MYNIKKAVSRLDFAAKIDDIHITDIKRGLGEFTPKPDKAVSFAALKAALKKAGYLLDAADLTIVGTLRQDNSEWLIEADGTKQRFIIEGGNAHHSLQGIPAGTRIEVTGDWQTVSQEAGSREVVRPKATTKVAAVLQRSSDPSRENRIAYQSVALLVEEGEGDSDLFLAPIRTTSPGLTVYKGGAVTPRYWFTRQHLGGLDVDRYAFRVGISYTPTPTIQLEAEIPYQGTTFDGALGSGSGSGLGNVTLWGKYRFFRALETWGDKQASLRFGLELPTGKKSAPTAETLDAPEFVRQQLSPIDGGTAFHSDIAYSQARGRFIFGANLEATLRGARDGYRMGHGVRINTDFEYVLLPLQYRTPGRELFAILETTYWYRSHGRVGGREVAGSSASEYYLAPGLQFTATPRLVLEASYQFPVVQNTGALMLRTDRNFLVGIRYLY